MRYKDELRIAGVTALFCCAMLMITAVVPKDTTVAKARKTFKEALETAADAEAQAQSEAEDAGFTVYTEDSNYDYEDNSYDDSGSDDTSTDTSDSDSSGSDSSGDTTYDPSYDDSPFVGVKITASCYLYKRLCRYSHRCQHNPTGMFLPL